MSASALKVGYRAVKSRNRPQYEDSLAVFQPRAYWQALTCGSVFAVADGVGGKPLAAEASQIVTKTVVDSYCRDGTNRVTYRLWRAVADANRRILKTSQQKRLPQTMSSTAVIAVIRGARIWVANVGDSRCYLVHGRKAKLLTKDHTFVAEGIRRKMFSQAEAAHHPMRSSLTQALGMRQRVLPALARARLKASDALLLCTDGLSDFVSEREIANVLSSSPPQQAAQALVNLAVRRHTRDDCTALVVKAIPHFSSTRHPRGAVPQSSARTRVDLRTLMACFLLSVSLMGILVLALLAG